jgi:hypothetical protein
MRSQVYQLHLQKQIITHNNDMNENRFTSPRTHTRVKFQPLTVSCELVCQTPASPAAQSVDSTGASPVYNPNRALTPTVIFPDVRAVDPDNIFHHGPANEYLGTLEWLVNEEPIAEVWTAGVDYVINTTATDVRGALTIYVNIPANEKVVLRFKGQFEDWRTGMIYGVESNDLALTTTDKGEDSITCSVDKPIITYDPLFDDLLLYDYKVARGITVTGTRASHINSQAFEQTVTVLLMKGDTSLQTLPTGVTMRVVKLGTSTPLSPASNTSPELLAATFPLITFDMRLISKGEYEVQFLQNSEIIARATIGLTTQCTMPRWAQGLRAADINPSQVMYSNTAVVLLNDRSVEYADLYYLIQWFTQAKVLSSGTWSYGAVKTWQRGPYLNAEISKLGIGVTKNDSFFEYWLDIIPHGRLRPVIDPSTHEVQRDANGEPVWDYNDNGAYEPLAIGNDILTDTHGNILIG